MFILTYLRQKYAISTAIGIVCTLGYLQIYVPYTCTCIVLGSIIARVSDVKLFEFSAGLVRVQSYAHTVTISPVDLMCVLVAIMKPP